MPERPHAVQLYVAHPLLAATLRQMIANAIEEQKETLAMGHLKELGDLRYQQGFIAGLRHADLLRENAEKELNKR
jgi:hypothetical protein